MFRVLLAGALSLCVPAFAVPDESSSTRAQHLEEQRVETTRELQDLSEMITLTEERLESLDAEIAAIAQNRAAIRQSLIETAAAQRETAAELAKTEARIGALEADEADLQSSLHERRGLLAEVLAALQRMSREPPPALLVKPQDALGSVRGAILLGSVVPQLREETERLMADLHRLEEIKTKIDAERRLFVQQMREKKEEEVRLARLFEEKERLEAKNRGRRAAEARRAAELAAKADDLQDLIASLDRELDAAREAARRAAEAQAREAAERRVAERRREEMRALREAGEPEEQEAEVAALAYAPAQPDMAPPSAAEETYDIASLRRDMRRMEPTAKFSTLKGDLYPPVAGPLKLGFGESDGLGSKTSGATFAAQAGDLVTAPADGRILYAGPFRSYGQLLIMDAGDGYHIVLAGMDEIDVGVGQFVLAGEPVAVMGARRIASAGDMDLNASDPSLYVEFRKDGKPVDPAPWWSD